MDAHKIIFLHGWATDHRVWAETIMNFDNAAAIDLPAHGGKTLWDVPALGPAVKEVSRCLDEDEKTIGIGWSLGGQALLAAAAERPECFKALVLVGTTPCLVKDEDFPWGQSGVLAKRMLTDMKNEPAITLRRFYKLNFTDEELETPEAKEFLKLYEEECYEMNHPEVATALDAHIQTDLREELKKIKIPILVIHGTEDLVCSVTVADFIKDEMANVEVVKFEGAGHAPFITREAKFTSTVADFINSL